MTNYLSKFLYILGDRKRALPGLVLLFLSNSFLDVVGLGLIGPFMALANNPSSIDNIYWLNWAYKTIGVTSKTYFIAILGLVIVFIFCLKSYFSFCNFRYTHKFSFDHQGELREKLLHAYLSVPYTFHLKRNTALLIQNIVEETHNFCHGILLQLLLAISNGILILLLVGLLAKTDIVATVTISSLLFLTFSFYYQFRTKIARWGKIASESRVDMIRTINHSLGGLKETRVIGCGSYFEEQIREQSERYAGAAAAFQNFSQLPRLSIEVILVAFLLGFVSLSLIFSKNTQNLIPTLSVFGLASIRLLPTFTHFLSAFSGLKNSSHVLYQLYNDLKELEAVEHEDADKSFSSQNLLKPSSQLSLRETTSFKRTIALDQISYRYPEVSETAVKNISLSINKGQSIALIGKSGAGKTTLVDIILGLLTPQSGDIRVDNVSIYKDLRSWQNLIGYIPQSIFLIDDTLERNIAFGVPDRLIEPARMANAIQVAQLEELVQKLPYGLQTSLGERGVRLSGGQRQRVGIARAIYHEREILVLDEATAALDNDTERLVTEAINSLAGTKTLIVIAHRLSTVENCDCIYMLKDGQVVKSGSYQEVVVSK